MWRIDTDDGRTAWWCADTEDGLEELVAELFAAVGVRVQRVTEAAP